MCELQSKVLNVNIPRFIKSSPELWLAQIESYFRLNAITDDTEKFDIVVIQLEEDIALCLEDIIIKPPEKNKFEALAECLLSKFMVSSETKLRRILQAGDACGLKPSGILAHMRRLAKASSGETIIRSWFLDKMPAKIRPLLAVWKEENLEELALLADAIVEAIEVSTIKESTMQAVSRIELKSLDDMYKSIDDLTLRLERMERKENGKQSGGSKRGSIPLSKPVVHNKNTEQPQLCMYHYKSGVASRSCHPDCPLWNSPAI